MNLCRSMLLNGISGTPAGNSSFIDPHRTQTRSVAIHRAHLLTNKDGVVANPGSPKTWPISELRQVATDERNVSYRFHLNHAESGATEELNFTPCVSHVVGELIFMQN